MKKEALFAIGWVLFFFSIGIILVAREESASVGSIYYGKLPDFHLQELQGEPFEFQDLLGKIWIIQFTSDNEIVFPSVPLSQIGKITVLVNGFGEEIFNMNYGGIIISGETEKVIRLAKKGFHFTEKHLNGEFPYPLVLVDTTGNIRGYYRATIAKEITRLNRDINTLVKLS